MTDLDRIFADIAVLEAVINDAREASDDGAVEKATRLLGALWQKIVETPELLRQLREPLSEAEWLQRYAPKIEAEQTAAEAVDMDWDGPDREPDKDDPWAGTLGFA